MRSINPYPYGHPPRSEDLYAVIAQALCGKLLEPEDRVLAEVDRQALDTLAEGCAIREDLRYFDEDYGDADGLPPIRLVLEDEQGPMGRIDLYLPNGSVYFYGRDATAWRGWAELRAPEAMLAWLASVGVPGPGEDYARWQSEEGRREREAWREALPANLRGPWCTDAEVLLDPWKILKAQEWLHAWSRRRGFKQTKRINAFLELYGQGSGPFARRPDYEALGGLLLGWFGSYERTVEALAKPRSPRALAGAGRHLLDHGTSPATREAQKCFDAETREAMIQAVGQLASAEDASRLRALLFPEPFATPAHTALVGASWTNRFDQVVADGEAAFALDGRALVRLEKGERHVLDEMIRLSFWPMPLAVREGRALVGKGERCLEIDRTGKVVATHPGRPPKPVDQERPITGALPDREGDADVISILPFAPTRAERAPLVTPDERLAFEAFAHLGLPEPPSFAWARRVEGCSFSGEATILRVHGEDPAAAPREVRLPGRLFRWTATEAHLVMALALGDRYRIAWLGERADTPTLSPELEIRPRALRFLCASGEIALLGVDLGAGEVLLAVPLPR